MLDMTDDLDVKLVLTDSPFEGRQLIAVRIFGMVFLEQFSDTHAFARQAGYIAGKQGLQFNPPGRRLPMPGCRTAEQFIQLPVGQGKKLFNTLAA